MENEVIKMMTTMQTVFETATTDATKTAGFACRVRSANAAARLGYDAEL